MHYPSWKYFLIIIVLAIASIYALPNLYPDEPAVQVTSASAATELTEDVLEQAQQVLKEAGIETHDPSFNNNSALIRLANDKDQRVAQELLKQKLDGNYVIALNLAQTTPEWLRKIGAKPLKLGLDLRGGVRFVLEVDINKTIEQRLKSTSNEIRSALRKERIPVKGLKVENNGLVLHFSNNENRDKAQRILQSSQGNQFELQALMDEQGPNLELNYNDATLEQLSEDAVEKNLTTLRNRISELGVSEALVQSQGTNRVVIELPGVQDTAQAKRVIGRTANLEFRLVADENATYDGGIPPAGTEAYPYMTLDGPPSLLKRQAILTGEKVQDASSGIDTESGSPKVDITLDSAGGRLMQNATKNAQDKQMAVLFIENKQKISYEENPETGEMEEVRTPYSETRIISQANINDTLGTRFQITGLDSSAEAAELALLLRSGALAAPMYFVEERTIGPSLGEQNIKDGLFSTKIGYLLVFIFMIIAYRLFGFIANLALAFNLIIMVATLSILGSSLTLPGIAGIVLTIGMAVDANVLIFERIREELSEGSNPKSAIVSGFDRAFSSIFDGNITTLLVAIILFSIGSGPIKGFAITLAIGILSSLFTAIIVTRALVHLAYGNRKNVNKLSIG